MLTRVRACMQLLKEQRHRRAAHLALQALEHHPGSTELLHLLAEAEAAVKWYPHFRDALVHVTLTGPATTFTIGNVLTVKYSYSHQKPEHENKTFKPFSDSLQGLVQRHDQKVMRNSHLPQEQVDRVLYKVGGAEALKKMRNAENHTEWIAQTLPKLPEQIRAKIPQPKHDIGHGWAEAEVRVVRECLEEMAREEAEDGGGRASGFKALIHAKAVQDSILYRLREELGVERSVEEVKQVCRLVRLYDELKLLQSCRFSASGEDHQDGDCIALVLVSHSLSSPHATSPLNGRGNSNRSPAHKGGHGRSPLHLHAAQGNKSDSSMSSDSEQDEGSDDGQADEDMVHIVLRRRVPPGNTGELDFSDASLADGTYEFRYYMRGSSTAACVSAPFSTCLPKVEIQVPSEPVVCGDAWSCSYTINLTRPHHHSDWLGVYQDQGTGPAGCAQRQIVPAQNHGRVELDISPAFPGTFHVKYHLGQHADAVAAVSAPFKVRINRVARIQETREVRVFLASTVADMLEEREALLQRIVPALQAACENRLITITLICLSFGMRGSIEAAGLVSEEETANLEHLYVSLQEIDRCTPLFLGVLGERYGWIPNHLDERMIKAYPWLKVPRNTNLLLPGVRASALEMGILNGFLVDPSLAKHNIFMFRDPQHARRTGVPAHKRKNFVPTSEYGREAVEKLRQEIRKVREANVIGYFDIGSFVSSTTIQLQAAIDTHFPPIDTFPGLSRVNLITHMYLQELRDRRMPQHPNAVPQKIQLYTDIMFPLSGRGGDGKVSGDVLDDLRPTYLRAEPGTGKSTLVASCVEHHLERLSQDARAKFLPAPRGQCASSQVGSSPRTDATGWQVGFSYQAQGLVHVVLVQHVGEAATVSTLEELLEHAMAFTKDALNLDLHVPWDSSDLLNLVWDWLDLVCQHCVFIWIIDGVDQMMPPEGMEAVSLAKQSPPDDEAQQQPANAGAMGGLTKGAAKTLATKTKPGNQGPGSPGKKEAATASLGRAGITKQHQTVGGGEDGSWTIDPHAHAQGELHPHATAARLIAARMRAQQDVCKFVMPLLDKTSEHYAGTAYPQLRLTLIGGEGHHPERPMDAALLDMLLAGGVRVVDGPTWVLDSRKSYMQHRLLEASVPERVVSKLMPLLENEIKPVTSDMEPGSYEPHDKFANTTFARYFAEELVRVCVAHMSKVQRLQSAPDTPPPATAQGSDSSGRGASQASNPDEAGASPTAGESPPASRPATQAQGAGESAGAGGGGGGAAVVAKPSAPARSRPATSGDDDEDETANDDLDGLLSTLRQLFDRCGSMDKLLAGVIQHALAAARDNLSLAVLVLKYLQLSHLGLRENELLQLVLAHEDASGEEFVMVMHALAPLTVRICGLVQLRPWAKKILYSLFSAADVDSVLGSTSRLPASPSSFLPGGSGRTSGHGHRMGRLDCLQQMAVVFSQMSNTERTLQELPLVLLRQAHSSPKCSRELLELVSSQQALKFMGPRIILRYIRATDWPLESVGMTLKSQFETAFDIQVSAGRRYDMSHVNDLVATPPRCPNPLCLGLRQRMQQARGQRSRKPCVLLCAAPTSLMPYHPMSAFSPRLRAQIRTV